MLRLLVGEWIGMFMHIDVLNSLLREDISLMQQIMTTLSNPPTGWAWHVASLKWSTELVQTALRFKKASLCLEACRFGSGKVPTDGDLREYNNMFNLKSLVLLTCIPRSLYGKSTQTNVCTGEKPVTYPDGDLREYSNVFNVKYLVLLTGIPLCLHGKSTQTNVGTREKPVTYPASTLMHHRHYLVQTKFCREWCCPTLGLKKRVRVSSFDVEIQSCSFCSFLETIGPEKNTLIDLQLNLESLIMCFVVHAKFGAPSTILKGWNDFHLVANIIDAEPFKIGSLLCSQWCISFMDRQLNLWSVYKDGYLLHLI